MSRLSELIAELCPDGVEYRALGEIATFGGGHTPSKADTANYEEGGIWWVTSKDVKTDVLTSTGVTLSESGAKRLTMYPSGTLVMVTRSGVLKRLLPIAFLSEPMTVNQDIKAILPNNEIVLSRYLFHFLKASDKDIRERYGKAGGTVDSINFNMVKRYRIPVPPIEVQREVVRILDEYTAAHNELVTQLEREMELRKREGAVCQMTLFKSYFGNRKANEHGWPMATLASVAKVGSSKRVFKNEFKSEGIPFFRGMEIGQLAEGVFDAPTLFIEEGHYCELCAASGTPKQGDLLLPSICPDGRVWLVDTREPFYFKDGRVLWIQSSKSEMNSTYLLYALKDILTNSYLSVASGSAFAEVKIFALAKAKIMMPPIKLQNEFENALEKAQFSLFNDYVKELAREQVYLDRQLAQVRNHLLSFPEKGA